MVGAIVITLKPQSNRSYNSLAGLFRLPPKSHRLVSLPLQSSIMTEPILIDLLGVYTPNSDIYNYITTCLTQLRINAEYNDTINGINQAVIAINNGLFSLMGPE